jgi:RimJ/RimL family protein N-acetyltransferase
VKSVSPIKDHRGANARAETVRLRIVAGADLKKFYEFQLDPEANLMAFTLPRNKEEFNTHWKTILADPYVTTRAMVADNSLAGCISCFKCDSHNFIGYWTGNDFWG